MEVPCGECGAKNQLGAIFCRECGEKLDIENLKPEEQKSNPIKNFKISGTLIKRLLTLAFLIWVFWIGSKIVAKRELPPSDVTPKTEKAANRLYERFFNRIRNVESQPGGTQWHLIKKLQFTEKQASLILKKEIESLSGSGGSYEFQDCYVEFIDGLYIKLYFVTKANIVGIKKDLHIISTFGVVSEGGKVTFPNKGASVGTLNAPGFMKNYFHKLIERSSTTPDAPLSDMLNEIKNVTFVKNKADEWVCTVHFIDKKAKKK